MRFCLTLFCLLLASPLAPAFAADAKQLWLEAEALDDKPVEAAAKWQQVVASIPKGESAGEGLTHEAAQSELFQALVDAGVASKDTKYFDQARTVAIEFGAKQQVFSELIIAKAAAASSLKYALKSLKIAKATAMKIENRFDRSEALHAVTLAALTKTKNGKLLFEWDGPEIAEDILPYVNTGQQRAQLMQMLAQYQQEPSGEWQKKLYDLVRINEANEEKSRNKALLELYDQALKADKFMIALDALTAVTDNSKQQDVMYNLFKKVFEAADYSRAAMVADRIDDGKNGANSWGKLAQHYFKDGETKRASDAAAKGYISALSTRRDDRRLEALTEIADYASDSGAPDIAEKALKDAKLLEGDVTATTPKAQKALASYVKSLAENGHSQEALTRLKALKISDPDLLGTTASAVAKALAEEGDPVTAYELMQDSKPELSIRAQKAYYAIAKAFAEKGLIDKAVAAAAYIKDEELRLKIDSYIKGQQSKAGANDSQKSALEAPFFSALDKQIAALKGSDAQEQTRIELTEMFIDEPNLPTEQWLAKIQSPKAHDEMLTLAALKLARSGDIETSSRMLKEIEDNRRRALAYRRLTKEVSLHTDLFGLIGGKASEFVEEVRRGILGASDDTQVKPAEIEKRFAEYGKAKDRGTEMVPPAASELGLQIPKMDFPERLEFDRAYVKEQLPPLTPFTLEKVYYENSFFINTKFKITMAYADNALKEGDVFPELLYIPSGTTSLPLLYDELKSRGMDGLIQKRGKEYTLHTAILIGPDASLIIDGNEVARLYQSKQDSAILVNAGKLYITDTSLVGWDFEKNAPAYASYGDQHEFRPFIASWSRSHTYLAGSEFIALGYNNHKSYGISISAGPEKLQQSTITEPQRPDGIITDNSFINAYYGFYSYEADNVALIGNEYRDGIIYGIDPHDRSHWLTIAFNTTYDSHKKHGIIVSREVNNSSYIGNLSFDNHGSGLMIDRLSTGTFVYGNTAFGNKQDGLTLFESSCNYISSNNFFHNKSLGIRVRNSQDNGIFFNRIANNKQGGIMGYISELLDDPAHKRRNFQMDPYADVAAMSLVGNIIEDNGFGVMAENMTALLLRGNRFINQSPRMFAGSWLDNQSYFTSQYDLANKGVFMGEKCPTGKWISHDCRFRKDGLLKGDAQSELERRVNESSCKVKSRQDANI